MGLNTIESRNVKYASILNSDGTIRIKVPEGTQGAEYREYETPKGEKGSKYELIYRSIDGMIDGLEFEESDYGQMIKITIKDGDESVVLSMPTNGNFGNDLMKKLPNVKFHTPVTIKPYSFETEQGKTLKGVNIYQDDVKITNFFWDEKTEQTINGMPVADKDKKYDKDDWKYFFAGVRKFLVKYTEDNVIPEIESFVGTFPSIKDTDVEETNPYEDNENDKIIDNIPF